MHLEWENGGTPESRMLPKVSPYSTRSISCAGEVRASEELRTTGELSTTGHLRASDERRTTGQLRISGGSGAIDVACNLFRPSLATPFASHPAQQCSSTVTWGPNSVFEAHQQAWPEKTTSGLTYYSCPRLDKPASTCNLQQQRQQQQAVAHPDRQRFDALTEPFIHHTFELLSTDALDALYPECDDSAPCGPHESDVAESAAAAAEATRPSAVQFNLRRSRRQEDSEPLLDGGGQPGGRLLADGGPTAAQGGRSRSKAVGDSPLTLDRAALTASLLNLSLPSRRAKSGTFKAVTAASLQAVMLQARLQGRGPRMAALQYFDHHQSCPQLPQPPQPPQPPVLHHRLSGGPHSGPNLSRLSRSTSAQDFRGLARCNSAGGLQRLGSQRVSGTSTTCCSPGPASDGSSRISSMSGTSSAVCSASDSTGGSARSSATRSAVGGLLATVISCPPSCPARLVVETASSTIHSCLGFENGIALNSPPRGTGGSFGGHASREHQQLLTRISVQRQPSLATVLEEHYVGEAEA